MNTFLEKYRVIIGCFLVLMILVGCGVLLWQKQNFSNLENNQDVDKDSELASIKQANEELQSKLKELEEKIISLEEEKKEVESGKVAGAISSTSSSFTNSSTSSVSNSQSISAKININTASTTELDKLPGVGPSRAEQIITYRAENGGFKSIEEIQNIKGIGPKTFEKMKDMITVE